jgi:hypothetical protein
LARSAGARRAADVVERLATALVEIAQRPDVREKLRNAGFAATGRGPQAFAKRIADDVPKWKEVIEKRASARNESISPPLSSMKRAIASTPCPACRLLKTNGRAHACAWRRVP